MYSFHLTNIFWYFIGYGIITFTVMRFMPPEKRKKILTYTREGSVTAQALSLLSLLTRYAMMALSLFLPVSPNRYLVFTGNLLYFTGLILATTAMWQFAQVEVDRPITTGIYRISRNPMQVMGFILIIGITVLSGSPYFWLLAAVNILSSYPMFFMQEKYCLKAYGREYEDYMRRTPRVLLIRPRMQSRR